ncbi:MAG: hypothetical protein ACRD09_10430, partial [Vicinamibacterales bacterium]
FRDLLEHFTFRDAGQLAGRLAPLFWSYVVGSTVGALVISIVAYWTALFFILANHRRLERAKHSNSSTSGM